MKTLNQPQELRYERKFLITDYSYKQVEQMLKFHPAAFSEIYHPRIVNNIYFDTFGFQSYYDNVDGEKDRMKVRIRWYGDLIGQIEKPILEFKIKNGLLGNKESYTLFPFQMDENFSKEQIIIALGDQKIPQFIRNHVLSLNPTVMTCYSRKYFMSADKNFRITIDHNLTYFRIGYDIGLIPSSSIDHKSVVLELKYDSAFGEDAIGLGNLLPFTMTKNSKYLQGIERIVF